MIAPHAIQRHPSNAQPRLRVLHSGCRRACWAMMMRQARRSSAIQHYTVRCGFLSQRSYVAPSRQRRSSSKRPRKELTYCPIYGFKSFLICAKDLTPALFCWLRGGLRLLSSRGSGPLPLQRPRGCLTRGGRGACVRSKGGGDGRRPAPGDIRTQAPLPPALDQPTSLLDDAKKKRGPDVPEAAPGERVPWKGRGIRTRS